MKREIDCRGLACPAPVLQTKDTIETDHPDIIKVTVDNEASKQNVIRFLKSQNFEVTVQEEGHDFHVIGRREGGAVPEVSVTEKPEIGQKKIMVMVANDSMGHGDDELGSKLMLSFLTTLKEMGDELWRLVFVNNGVKLTIGDAEVLPVLKEYEEQGLHIMYRNRYAIGG